MKRTLLLIFICINTLMTVFAQSSYWEETKGPYGGEFSLVKAPGDTLYAVHQINWKKTYRSTDNGQTWQQLTFLQQFFPTKPLKYVSVSEAGTIYVRVPGYSTYKTTNDGQTWTGSYSFSVELASGVMLRKETSSITRSINGGQSWTTVLNFPSGIISSPTVENTPFGGLLSSCYRTLPNGDTTVTFYRSFDEGITWAPQDVSPDFSYYFFASPSLILCIKTDTLFRSDDAGASFQPTGLTGLYSASYMKLPSGRILIEGSYASDDGGISWEPFDGRAGNYIPIAPLADGTIFTKHQKCILRSTDGGTNWQFAGMGMRANPVNRLVFVSDSVYYAYTEVGLWKTTDAGENWNLFDINNILANSYAMFEVTANGGVVALKQLQQLYWSADGNDFMEITPPSGLVPNYGANLAVNPQNGHIFINTLQGLERSTNFGHTWELLSDSLNFVAGIGFHPSGRLIACNDYKEILVSNDNGNTWAASPILSVPGVLATKVAPNGTVYLVVATSNSELFLWRSKDAGDSWVELPQELDLNLLWWYPIFEIASNGHLFIGAGLDITLSTNAGLTWQNLPNPADSAYVAQNYARLSSLAISPSQHLYAGTLNFDLYRSINPVSFGSTIEGVVQVDADDDCLTDDGQVPLQNRTISAQGDGFTYFTKTDQLGWYRFFVDTGSYNLAIRNLHDIWWGYCDSTQVVDIPAYYSTDTLNFSAIALAYCPLITVNVAIPTMRRCFNNPVSVQYCNQGSITADSAYIDIFLDPFLNFISSNQPHNDLGNNQIRFFLGNLPSGDCGQFSFTTYVNCDSTILGQTHCITAHGYPDTLCIPLPSWSGANINARVNCQDSIVQFQLHNTGTGSSQVLDYIIIEDDVVMFQGQQQYAPDQSISIPVTANGHTYRIESEQEPGHPFSTRAIAFEEGCGGFESLGFINQFSVNGITPSWHRVCRENTGSFDPNDKHGYPLGFGADNRIRPGQALEYMIRFQNTGTDTAFTVVIRDSLSAWLDPASVVPGAASHPYTWQLQGSGEISFTFSNILLPDSTTNLAGSQGFVTFSVAQQPNVPLETQILNTAAIFFDFNAPVITNETRHTVGLNLISSTLELPKSKGQNAVQVSPNPASTHATFQLAKGPFKGHRLQLFSPMGKLVFETAVSGNQMVVPRNKLPAGAYGWRVADARGMLVGSGVLVFR